MAVTARERIEGVLELLDAGLESFFRATASLSATDVDVSFEAPDREWSGKLTRPTVNVFLWDIRRSARAQAGVETIERDGVTMRRQALPVLEFRYVITTWTAEHADERAVLSALMRSLLRYGRIPTEYLPEAIRYLGEPDLLLARAGEEHVDVFKALEGQLKPSINAIMYSRFDIDAAVPVGPPVGRIAISSTRIGGERGPERRRIAGDIADAAGRGAIGVVVRSSIDATRVNDAGQFLLRAEVGDELVVEIEPPLTVVVPTTGGVRID